MKETIIEVHDYCLGFSLTIDGKDFKDFENRKEYIKELIDQMEDGDLEHILQNLLHHHPNVTDEEYTHDVCEQCGDNNIYEKIILNKKL